MDQLLRNIEISNHSQLAMREHLQIMSIEHDISCCFAFRPIRVVLFRPMGKQDFGDGIGL